jgi:hypothetical protein
MTDKTNPKDLLGAKKTPMTLLPVEGVRQGAMAMKHGADKYGAYNWRDKKVQALIYADAIIRHVYEWVDGNDVDKDSGLHPLAHVVANGALVLDAIKHGNLIDNRPSKLFTKECRDNLSDIKSGSSLIPIVMQDGEDIRTAVTRYKNQYLKTIVEKHNEALDDDMHEYLKSTDPLSNDKYDHKYPKSLACSLNKCLCKDEHAELDTDSTRKNLND